MNFLQKWFGRNTKQVDNSARVSSSETEAIQKSETSYVYADVVDAATKWMMCKTEVSVALRDNQLFRMMELERLFSYTPEQLLSMCKEFEEAKARGLSKDILAQEIHKIEFSTLGSPFSG